MNNKRINITRTEVLSDNWYTLRKVTYEYLKENGEWETQAIRSDGGCLYVQSL